MDKDLIYLNGKPVRWGDTGIDPDTLLGCNFVYQKIHTIAHRTLHAEVHAAMAQTSYRILYGTEPTLSAAVITEEVNRMLSANRYPQGSNLVVLYLVPPADGKSEPVRMLSCEKQLLYKGYTLWHNAVKAMVTPYEYPFPHHKTAASLAAHNYSLDYAIRNGADIALTENYGGMLTSAGEHPLFAVRGSDVFTTPAEEGTADSVERRLGILSSERAGWNVSEQPVLTSRLRDYEELFYVTPQGMTSIGSVGDRLYPTSAAKSVAAAMAGLTDTDL